MASAEMDDFVNQVRERSDIYAVVSRYLTLNLKGGRYWACCPFHNEKTPSFTISPERGMFYCFGCHEGGNVFKFISMMEKISYFEAIKLQAERLGIAMPSRKKSPEEIQRENKRKSLLEIMSLAQIFYHNCLTKTAKGAPCRKYLESRGITDGVIKKFNLGFAPSDSREIIRTLESNGAAVERLVEAGIAVNNSSSAGVHDRMFGRMIIPIADAYGNVVAFGGRVINPADEPKYLNTPETSLFSKGKMLFGLDKTGRAITTSNSAIVVEGYMDAIALVNAGIENVVATLGTALTSEQAKLLARYTRKIILCYDSDEAGQRATIRALPILQKENAEVLVVAVPDGKDPDEFLRKHGKGAFEKLVKNAEPFVDYRINYIVERANLNSLAGKMAALREILPALIKITDVVLRNEYVKELSNTLHMDEGTIKNEWKKLAAKAENVISNVKSISAAKSIAIQSNSLIAKAGRTIIKTAWYEDVLGYVLMMTDIKIFVPVHQEIIGYLERCYNEGRHPSDLSAAEELSEEANVELARVLSNSWSIMSQNDTLAFEDSVNILRRMTFENRCEEIRSEIYKCYSAGDEAVYQEKFHELLNLEKEMDELYFGQGKL